jgi:hypothetical protein
LPPDEARRSLAARGVGYVLTCGPRPPSGLAGAQLAASLWGELQAGHVPEWLSVEPAVTGPFRLYRVRS